MDYIFNQRFSSDGGHFQGRHSILILIGYIFI
nr:MAG TPA: hypothetical protein [Caudoviricetes sp.]